jgi:hypothetical protein
VVDESHTHHDIRHRRRRGTDTRAAAALDKDLHDTIRQINRIPHQDESRHIAFGRELVRTLFEDFRSQATDEELAQVSGYLKRYMSFSFESLFNPQVYRDAGVGKPLEIRRRLLDGPRGPEFEQLVFRKTLSFLTKNGILGDEDHVSSHRHRSRPVLSCSGSART